MRPQAKLKVLINGAGIAGNALALWLCRLGHHVTVVERFPGLRLTGLQLDLRGDGVQVMKRMGIEDAIRAKAAPEEGMQVVDKHGKQWAYFPVRNGSQAQSLTTECEIMRGDLCRVLHDEALQSQVPPNYIFGTSIQSFEQKGDQVEVRFDDNMTDHFDLVVGADGQWSRTRRLMNKSYNQPGTPDDIHVIPGLYFAYFTMRRPMAKGEKYVSTSYMAPGRRGIMTRRHSPDELQVMLSCRNSSERLKNARRGNVAEEKEALADIFRDAGWIAEDIVQGMREAEDFYCERMGLVKTEPWSRGHVTLVGDAAHCPTVLTGMGTTSAMVGAYILAGEISSHVTGDKGVGGLEVALRNYEQKFRPFMDQVQAGIVEKATYQYTMPSSAFSIGAMNWGLRLASFFNVNIAEAWGIKEVVKGWELPEYKELNSYKQSAI